jgi:NAD(P)-dependent dehydrogenase (short-subunit alcohol dehydrogenase family)
MSVVLIAGVGPGLGLALVERFHSAGMRVVASARDGQRLEKLLLGASLNDVVPIACDVSVRSAVDEMFDRTTKELGVPEIVVFNAGAFEPGSILDVRPESFDRSWRVGCFGGFNVGQRAAQLMVPEGRGTILFTGATASLRGSAGFASLAVPKFGLRALAQSMARELGPRGIHVAHVIVDGMIDHPRFGAPSEARLSPAAIAETYYQLAIQPKSAWTQELDLRPSSEKF